MLKRPMLAAKATEEELKQLFRGGRRFLLSPKIDGVRALVLNGQLVSRTMKPIRNTQTQQVFGSFEFEGLDGELVVGNPWDKNLMQQTTSGVMSFSGRPNAVYYIFDRWDIPKGFEERHSMLVRRFGEDFAGYIRVVPHTEVSSYDEMLIHETEYLQKGYEGVMLRLPNAAYKQNRSTLREAGLVKVKRFNDHEAVIIGWERLYRNHNEAEENELGLTKRSHAAEGKVADDLIGALIVKDLTTGVEFSIGSGFTLADRQDMWEVRDSNLAGRIVKYKCFDVTGTKDKPRFPIFLGFRDKDDM